MDKKLKQIVKLNISGQPILFNSVEEFEFALNGRTSIPAKKISDIVHLSVEQLNDESITIKNVESYFVSMVADYMQNPQSIDEALNETEHLVFSQDHNWRDIFAALNNCELELLEYKHLAIIKYLQYLSARQDLINYLYSEKTKLPPQTISDSMTIESNVFYETADLNSSTLDMVRALHGQKLNNNMERLPKGEKISINVNNQHHIDVVLSKYKCKLVKRGKVLFVDQDNNEYVLKLGKNIIGRDPICSIILDRQLRDISRVHMVIILKENDIIEITDLSSHGTFLHNEHYAPQIAAVN